MDGTPKSAAESENNALADVRALDPFSALATLVERCAERMATQQLCAIEHSQARDQVMPGVPPDVVKRLKDTRALATKMSSTRTRALGDGVWQVGRLGHSTATWKVSLADYTCCPALQLSRYPCVHICHVCSVAKVNLSDYMPKCHTVRGWRAQLGLSIAGASSQGLVEVNPIPHIGTLIAEQPEGIDLRLVIAVRSAGRPSAREDARFRRAFEPCRGASMMARQTGHCPPIRNGAAPAILVRTAGCETTRRRPRLRCGCPTASGQVHDVQMLPALSCVLRVCATGRRGWAPFLRALLRTQGAWRWRARSAAACAAATSAWWQCRIRR